MGYGWTCFNPSHIGLQCHIGHVWYLCYPVIPELHGWNFKLTLEPSTTWIVFFIQCQPAFKRVKSFIFKIISYVDALESFSLHWIIIKGLILLFNFCGSKFFLMPICWGVAKGSKSWLWLKFCFFSWGEGRKGKGCLQRADWSDQHVLNVNDEVFLNALPWQSGYFYICFGMVSISRLAVVLRGGDVFQRDELQLKNNYNNEALWIAVLFYTWESHFCAWRNP